MSDRRTIKRKLRVATAARGRKKLEAGEETDGTAQRGRVPRITRLMALAIRFDQLIRNGVVSDQAELARVGRVSRARLTQIMNLLNLAPDIQAELLSLPRVERGREVITERSLRPIADVADWRKQRRRWARRQFCVHLAGGSAKSLRSLPKDTPV